VRPLIPLAMVAALSLAPAAPVLSDRGSAPPSPTVLTIPEGCPGNCNDPVPEAIDAPGDEGGFPIICNTQTNPNTISMQFVAPGDRLCVGDPTRFPVKYWEIRWRTDHAFANTDDFMTAATFAVGGNEPPGTVITRTRHISGTLYFAFKSWSYNDQEASMQPFGPVSCN
jgi:hypothetical protein